MGATSPILLAVRLGADLAAAVPFYGAVPARGGHSENPGGDSGPSRGTRHPTRSDVAGIRRRLDGSKRSATKAISTRTLFTASIVMRRRNATTKPRPIWPGSARSTGSTNTRPEFEGTSIYHYREEQSMELGTFSVSLAVKDLEASRRSTRSSVSRPSPEMPHRTG